MPQPHHRARAPGQRRRRGHRARGRARRTAALQGRADPLGLPRRALRRRQAAVALREPRLRAELRRRRGRQRLLAPSCTRCSRRSPRRRSGSRSPMTGSVNQHGDVQAIGGVNEKIEGFFDVCQARGLTGAQGVLIPAANVRHLMLRARRGRGRGRGPLRRLPGRDGRPGARDPHRRARGRARRHRPLSRRHRQLPRRAAAGRLRGARAVRSWPGPPGKKDWRRGKPK